jgi:thiamine pyrophosphate-dependent acetolactate synthase large subunit-like protein
MPRGTVREAAFDILRRRGLTNLFANPGSTEVPLLADLPEDLRFVLALQESSVVGIATGWALARDEPALAILHTTAGLGNAVGALATALVNRARVRAAAVDRQAVDELAALLADAQAPALVVGAGSPSPRRSSSPTARRPMALTGAPPRLS